MNRIGSAAFGLAVLALFTPGFGPAFAQYRGPVVIPQVPTVQQPTFPSQNLATSLTPSLTPSLPNIPSAPVAVMPSGTPVATQPATNHGRPASSPQPTRHDVARHRTESELPPQPKATSAQTPQPHAESSSNSMKPWFIGGCLVVGAYLLGRRRHS